MAGRFALMAARECLDDSTIGAPDRGDGLILGTSTGGQRNNEDFVFTVKSGNRPPNHHFHRQGVVAAPARLVARELNIQGPVSTISTACTSSANAIALGALWIRQKRCRRVFVGGSDDLCMTTLAGFHTLMLTGEHPCRPFAENRPGMTLGEGSAFLLLESGDEVEREGRTAHAELRGWGLSADAYHLTAPREGGLGAIAAMGMALDQAGLETSDVHWINAHGTGTELNDAMESQAINTLFGEHVPVSSNKGLFGHALGAAGVLEAVVSILAIRHRLAPPNFRNAIAGPDCPIRLVPADGLALPAHPTVLSNSFGFGGSNCALIFGDCSGEVSA